MQFESRKDQESPAYALFKNHRARSRESIKERLSVESAKQMQRPDNQRKRTYEIKVDEEIGESSAEARKQQSAPGTEMTQIRRGERVQSTSSKEPTTELKRAPKQPQILRSSSDEEDGDNSKSEAEHEDETGEEGSSNKGGGPFNSEEHDSSRRLVPQSQPLLDQAHKQDKQWLNLEMVKQKSRNASEDDQKSSSSRMFHQSSDISLSMDELSVNQSFVKRPFERYAELDLCDKEKFRRSTTLVKDGALNELQYEDFYEEIEHLIRQENIQQNQIRGSRLTHGTSATQSLNDQSFHRSQGHSNVSHQQKLFHLLSNFELGGSDKVWHNDAEGGYLSHSKMLYERNQFQVRKTEQSTNFKLEEESGLMMEQEVHEYVKFPICKTKTGWFHCSRDYTHSQIDDELGLGISIYFKQLKALVIMLLVCVLLSIPSLVLFWSGQYNDITEGFRSTKSLFASFTLGNIGQRDTYQCKSMELDGLRTEVDLYCSFGEISALAAFGTGEESDNRCKANKMSKPKIADECDMRPHIQDDFDSKCVGQKSCKFALLATYQILPQCQVQESPHFIVAVDCQKELIELPWGSTITRQSLAITVCVFDLIIVLWVILNISLFDIFINREDKFVDDKYLQMTDFTVRIKNMPPQREYHTLHQLKAQLSTHLTRVVQGEKQVLEQLRDAPDDPGEIVNIHFGQKKFLNFKKLMLIAEAAKKGQTLRILQSRTANPKKIATYEKKIEQLKVSVMILVRDYKNVDPSLTEGEIKSAYIVFKSMEGAARCIQAYEYHYIKWVFFRCCLCCFNDKIYYDKKMFHNKWLYVDKAIEPSLIMWENLGYNKKDRCLRIICTTITAAVLLAITMLIILVIRSQDSGLRDFTPEINCTELPTVSMEVAYQDQIQKLDDRDGWMHCFCRQQFYQAIEDGEDIYGALDFEFTNGQKYCREWLPKYIIDNVMIILVPLIIIVVNFISKTILRRMTKFEKRQSKPQEVYASAFNMFVLSFLNSGVVILLVNFRVDSMIDSSVPILKGDYKKFSTEWYRLVGSTICLTVFFMTLMPHAANISMQVLFCIKRCWDRKCTFNLYKTRKMIQNDYEDVNKGNEFMLEFRYSNILAILAVIFMYSSSMPILYIFGVFYFSITYWIDKWLLFRYYRKPVMFDSYLARKSLSWFKYILLMHCIGFAVMFSNSQIIPLDEVNTASSEHDELVTAEEVFDGVQTQTYIGVICLASVLYALWRFLIRKSFRCIEMLCCNDKNLQIVEKGQVAIDSNFYNCISFVTLRQELYMVQQNLEIFHQMYRNKSFNEVYLSPHELKSYIQALYKRKDQIVDRIRLIAELKLGKRVVDKIDDTVVLIAKLNVLEKQGLLSESQIKDELQSYDILRNPVYSRLCELKNVLDYNKGQDAGGA